MQARTRKVFEQFIALHQKPKFNWQARAFDKQRAFILDPARLKASWTTRRGAKSYCDGIYLIKEAMENPGCNCLYMGLTRLSAKAIIWKDVLKDINIRDNLGLQFNETELTVKFPNGSIIYVAGVDVDEDERKKLFGRKYRLAVLDEAALYTVDLYDLIYVALKPAMTDMRGTIVLSGMSSNITQGLFYDVTTGKEPGWSVHSWTAYDNPFVAVQWAEEIEEIRVNRPLFMQTARYKQAYLNQWVVDEDALVYRYSDDTNSAKSLPVLDTDWHYILSVDLGHSPDPTAFVVSAYNDTSSTLYYVYADKHLGLDITAVANKIKDIERVYTFDVRVVDNANKQAVEELNNRHGSMLIPADKTGKSDFINLMNDEFIQQRIFILPGAEGIAKEMKALVWETEGGKIKIPRKEHPTLANHLTDAALYGWRHCYQYLFTEKQIDRRVRLDHQEIWEKEHMQKLVDRARQEQQPNHLELDHKDVDELFDFSLDDL